MDFQIPTTPETPRTPVYKKKKTAGSCALSVDLSQEAEEASPVPGTKQAIRTQWGKQEEEEEADAGEAEVDSQSDRKVVKRKPACLKRPAASTPGSKKEDLTSQDFLTEEQRRGLHLMFYNTGAAAVRVRGGKQVLQVKAESPALSKRYAAQILSSLREGCSKAEALSLKQALLSK